MKVTYDEKTNSDFTPFRLILEFETDEDLNTFNKVLFAAELRLGSFETDNTAIKCYELINQIHDAIKLKTK